MLRTSLMHKESSSQRGQDPPLHTPPSLIAITFGWISPPNQQQNRDLGPAEVKNIPLQTQV